MRWFDERLAWALLLLTPLAIVFGKLIARRLRTMTLDIRQDESRIQMQVQEGMEHNAVLRSLGSEQWIIDRLDSMQQRLRGNVMLNMVPEVIHATASIDRLEELEQTIQVPTVARTGKTSSKGINFNDVSFCYAKGDREILSHFTHEFKAGSKTAIMGETGIGKTTLFRLILGFIEPTSGQIAMGGELCFVPQGNTLMSGTIRYNLQLAKPNATEDELREVHSTDAYGMSYGRDCGFHY